MALTVHQPEIHEDALLFERALTWIEAGHEVSLATVVSTWGSSPRPVGSHLLIRDDNLFEGSVSGGCIEGEVVTEALKVMRDNICKILEFGVTDKDAWEAGLTCGGQVKVFVQKISPEFKNVIVELEATCRSQQAVALLLDLETGAAALHKKGEDVPEELSIDFSRDQSGMKNNEANDKLFVRVFNTRLRLFIVGAVHIAQVLAKLAVEVGYEVVVIDPRDTWGAQDRFRGITIDRRWPSTALEKYTPDARTAIVTLCHDPKLDDPALLVALKSDAFYIGSLGSRKTHAKRVERLISEGVCSEVTRRIKAPVGLNIGAVSPAEIALSIMAQITQELRQLS